MQDTRNKVLIISYQFPPDTGSIQRVINHIRYLPENGFLPIVLTHRNEQLGFEEVKIDDKNVRIVRVGSGSNLINKITRILTSSKISNDNASVGNVQNATNENILVADRKKILFKWVKNFFYWPDVYIGWVPVASIKSISLIKKENIKLIYLVSPPHSSTLIIFFIKLFTRAKVIIDFRDPWSDDVDIVNPTILHKKLHAISEKLVCKFSDRVITTTDYHTNVLVERYFKNDRNRVITITNGFNSSEFSKPVKLTEEFTIVYTGNFDSTRNPYTFLKAISNITKKDSNIFKSNSIQFFGNINPIVQSYINEFELNDIVVQHGLKSYSDAIILMKQASLLLLIVHNDEVTSKFSIPAKLFEYMASNRPILAITPNGVASEIINKYSLGDCFQHSDIANIEDFILKSHDSFTNSKSDKPVEFNADVFANFERKKLTQKLSSTLSELLNR